MVISQDEEMLAVISGKNLVMNEQYPNQLFIFKRNHRDEDETDTFSLKHRIIVKEKPEFAKISMRFSFKLPKIGQLPNAVIFAKQDSMMEVRFDNQTENVDQNPPLDIKIISTYPSPLNKQAEFFLMNDDQSICVVGSETDGLYYNRRTNQYVDLDEEYQISNIKEIYHDHEERVFYMLANKYQEKLGIFLIVFNEKDPSRHQFILRWKNKLDISDANVFIVRNKKKKFKELVVSFKTIFINVYNVCVMDISNHRNIRTIFRHESFQLWES